MNSEDRKQLKKLIKQYNSNIIIQEVNNICNEYFNFWKKQIQHNETENTNNSDIITSDKNKKITKKIYENVLISKIENNDIDNTIITKEEGIVASSTNINACPDTNLYDDTKPCRNIIECPDTKKMTNSEIKRIQREKEAQKRIELDVKGITIDSLLTEKNLREWIVNENRTYAYIAREYVGCSEDKVSIVAKSFGIESKLNPKKRAIMYKKH